MTISTDPAHLTAAEQYAEALAMFSNFERYVAQSAATKVNEPAPLPPREPLTMFE